MTTSNPPPLTPGVTISPTGKKTFIPLENNPSVFTTLSHHLGLSPTLTFHDIYSPSQTSQIPRPAHSLILISPAPIWSEIRTKHDSYNGTTKKITFNSSGPEEPIIWFQQTIGHACGLYSLIHAVANGSATQFIQSDSLLDNLLQKAIPLQRTERAEVLYTSHEVELAHMACAVQGDSPPPSSEESVGYHFITFVKGQDGHLWELEGCWDPIDRGELGEGEDVLSERGWEAGVGRYLSVAEGVGNVDLSIVALGTGEE